MTLHINKPEYSEERAKSQPLSFEEQKTVVEAISFVFKEYITLDGTLPLDDINIRTIQSLFYHYENLQEEVNRLRDKANAYDELMKENKL